MATYYNTAVTPKGSPEEAANQQLMAKAGALTANPGKRDIPGNLMPDFLAGKLSFEDLQSQIGGSADFNPSIGPKINYGQGNQSLSPAQLGSLAQGKSVQDVSNMIPQNVAANQQVQQENQSQYAKLAQQFKGTPPPNANQGIGAVNSAMSAANPPQNPNVQNFLQNDPTIQSANQNWMNFNNPQNLQTELMTQMQKIVGQQSELGSLKAEYMNIQNVMGGTEDDLRAEIQKTGGFATDSQVQALAIARNKTLMKKAALLQNQMALQQDAIQNSQQLLNFEKDMAATQFTQQMQMAQFAYQIQHDAQTAASSGLKMLFDNGGAAAIYSGNPTQDANTEKLLHLPSGSLAKLAKLPDYQRMKLQNDYQKSVLDLQKAQNDLNKSSNPYDDTKLQQKLEKDYASNLVKQVSSRSGDLGIQNAKVSQAEHLVSLFDQYKDANGNYQIPQAQYEEIAIGLANLLSGSATATEGMREAIVQRTSKGDLAGALTYITGTPQTGSTQKIFENLRDSIVRQGSVAQDLRQDAVGVIQGLKPTDLDPTRAAALEKNTLHAFSAYEGKTPISDSQAKSVINTFVKNNPSLSQQVAKLYQIDPTISEMDVYNYMLMHPEVFPL